MSADDKGGIPYPADLAKVHADQQAQNEALWIFATGLVFGFFIGLCF